MYLLSISASSSSAFGDHAAGFPRFTCADEYARRNANGLYRPGRSESVPNVSKMVRAMYAPVGCELDQSRPRVIVPAGTVLLVSSRTTTRMESRDRMICGDFE